MKKFNMTDTVKHSISKVHQNNDMIEYYSNLTDISFWNFA